MVLPELIIEARWLAIEENHFGAGLGLQIFLVNERFIVEEVKANLRAVAINVENLARLDAADEKISRRKCAHCVEGTEG